MITDAIVSAFLGAMRALLTLLPDTGPVTLGDGVSTTAAGWAGAANAFFPVTATLTVLGVLVALQLVLMLWDLAVWVWHQFWGSS